MVERARGASLAATDEPLDGEDVARVAVALLLRGQELLDLLVLVVNHLVFGIAEKLIETIDEVHEARHLLVAHRNVAAGLVGHMHLMTLSHQTLDGATHRDDVVVGMGGEHDDTLWIGFRTLGPIGIIGIGFAAWPASNSMLQVVENLDVGVIGRAIERQKFGEAVLVVVFVGEFQDGLARLLAQPNQRRTHQLVGPRERSNQPRMYNARQTSGSSKIDDHMHIVVGLQERGGNGVGDGPFHRLANDVGLLLAPCGEEYLAGREDGADTHRYGARRHRFVGAEAKRGLLARRSIDQHEARRRRKSRSRLVDGDVTYATDAQQHEVDASEGLDALLVELAMLLNAVLRYCAIGREDVLAVDVNMVEKPLAKLAESAMLGIGREREKLVGIENHHVAEAHALLLMTTDEFRIDRCERGSGSQAEHTKASLALTTQYLVHHNVGDAAYGFLYLGKYVGWNLLHSGDFRTVYSCLRLVEFFRYFVQYDLRTKVQSHGEKGFVRFRDRLKV